LLISYFIYFLFKKFDLGDASYDILTEIPNVKKMLQRRFTSIEIPIQSDILQNLPQFCFPGYLKAALQTIKA
jgi:hypothetical protein